MAGVVVAILMSLSKGLADAMNAMGASIEHSLAGVLGPGGYQILGLVFFAAMAGILWRVARRPQE